MRVGIAGAGFMARTHAEAYDGMDCEIAGVASPSGFEGFLDDLGLESAAYTGVEALCDREEIDYLDICTPTHTHLEIVRTAADRGLDIFLEKPIAGSIEEAQEIRAVAEAAGVALGVGHVVRFLPAYRKAAGLEIGEPGVARARRLSPFPDWGEWFGDREKSGGLFVDLAIHDLDYLRWVWGEVERVFARRTRAEHAEHGFVTLRFANGAVGYVEGSWAQPESRTLTTELELAGSDGMVEFASDEESPYCEWTADGETVDRAFERDGYRRELEAFADTLRAGEEPPVGPDEAIEALRLALAAERSADLGEPVAPEEVVA
ncbi:Gfo/Idh/MocA family protein [Saliphagus infecundisoli]|uniref:Gfo/Idh/MocA family protein n=1 Tax=Saliphagus infecundisoli TaxID=1849069 RepID=A0ABD5QA00_9EURY|nr:Gfo/Idh/MocA family oxidoreductase [Saliphagus infecundisoli]